VKLAATNSVATAGIDDLCKRVGDGDGSLIVQSCVSGIGGYGERSPQDRGSGCALSVEGAQPRAGQGGECYPKENTFEYESGDRD
jgi:hypothetical protein